MTIVNHLGLEVTAASDTAVAAFDRTVTEYLGMGRNSGQHLKEALAADPDMVMAHVLRGSFFKLMAAPPLLPRAAQALAQAQAHAQSITPRERTHVAALAAWCAGDLTGAVAAWEEILRDFPRDILALRLAHYLHFYSGDSVAMRDSVARVLPAWDPALPGYGFVLGMHAFGLEETGDYAAAEKAGRAAVEMNPCDAWAVHAVAHVMDSAARPREGVEWLQSLEPSWSAGHNFRYHLWWHRALMHLALGDHAGALALYDERLWDPSSDEYLDLCNDAALLARLELRGVDVGSRWQPLADKVEAQAATRVFAFIDAHYALTLAAAGRFERAQALLAALADYAAGARDTQAQVMRDVGLPLCEALVAWRRGECDSAALKLARVRPGLHRIGGSHTQRDLFLQILAACH